MELTNAEIFICSEPLQTLASKDLPVLVSLQVAKLSAKLNDPLAIIQNVFNKLVDTYGERQEGGEIAVIGPNDILRRPISPGWDKFVQERDKLLTQTVELDVEKIQLPLEVDGKPLKIAPSVLMALDKFIDVGGAEK